MLTRSMLASAHKELGMTVKYMLAYLVRIVGPVMPFVLHTYFTNNEDLYATMILHSDAGRPMPYFDLQVFGELYFLALLTMGSLIYSVRSIFYMWEPTVIKSLFVIATIAGVLGYIYALFWIGVLAFGATLHALLGGLVLGYALTGLFVIMAIPLLLVAAEIATDK